MKTIFALFLAAALHAESAPADEPSSAPAAVEPHAESAASGGASSPSEPAPSPRGLPPQAGGGAIGGNGGNGGQLELVDNPPPSSRAAKPRAPAAARPASRGVPRSPCRAKPQVPCPPLQAEVSLVDGSSIKGVFRQRFLPALSPNLGRIRIDLRAVESIAAVAPQNGATADFRVAFKNGDRLTVRFPDGLRFLPFDTLLGRVRLPLRAVSSLAFAGDETDALLYYCTFDDAQSITRPAAGPAGLFLGGDFVPGKVGNALFVKAGTHAAEVPFPTGLMQPQGCIEFWGKIPGATKETRYPDGGNPTFFAMKVGKWVNTFVKYTANDGFGTGGLHADLPGSAYISSLPSWSGSASYPDFLGDPAAWHHYALVWSDKGLDAASEALGRRVVSALYVDGKLVNPAYGTNGPDRARFLSEFVDNPIVLAFPLVSGRQSEWQNRVDYLIDDFKIWSAPISSFDLP